jgi:hypothetical protein
VIALVTGTPGAGKSYYTVCQIIEALEAGKFVATNVELAPGWEHKVANHHPLRWLIPGRRRRLAASYRERVYISPDLDELFRLRLAGRKEGRGWMILDEAHNWMNARTWDSDEDGQSTKAEAVRRRLQVVRFFSQHRKLGWDIFLISQDEKNIDRQVRSLFEYHIKLKNLRRMKVAGIPISPFNIFLAVWMWHDGAKSIVKRQARRLVRWKARLYDTMALSHGLEDHDAGQLIWLPVTPAEAEPQNRPARASAAEAAPRRDLPAIPPPPPVPDQPDLFAS